MTEKVKRTHKRFGRRILDAKKPFEIRVRPCDGKKAVCKDHQKCVIANAIMRLTGAKLVDVGPNTVFIGRGAAIATRYKLDSTGKEVVRYFDENAGLSAPSAITLRSPLGREKTGTRSGVNGGKHRKGRHGAKREATR